MASANQTRDHEEIRRWAAERGGIPTIVKGTGGLLRIDFIEGAESGGREPSLEETDWDRWFEVFDNRNLTFLCSPERNKRFFKLISEETAGAASTKRKTKAPRKVTSERQRVRVARADGRWSVEMENGRRRTFPSKQIAVQNGRQTAHRYEPSELIIERADGREERHYTYGEPRALH